MPSQGSEDKVLLVHDRDEVRKTLATALEHRHYAVKAFGRSKDAIRAATSTVYDFAVVGLELDDPAGLGGIAAAELVAKNSRRAKIVMLSGSEQDEKIRRALESALGGAYGYVCWLDPGNSISRLVSELERLAAAKRKEKCVVIMPGSDNRKGGRDARTELFAKHIKPAVESAGPYDCTRLQFDRGDALEQITRALVLADVVIADLTNENPNVLYELGIRHAKGDATVLICEGKTTFTLHENTLVVYERTEKGLEELKARLHRALQEINREILAKNYDNNRSLVRRTVLEIESNLGSTPAGVSTRVSGAQRSSPSNPEPE
ncbi:MAG TPA: response regulator [Polyangiaceae bacterium]|nr:response regulator [Polyangiaceae bacterium]